MNFLTFGYAAYEEMKQKELEQIRQMEILNQYAPKSSSLSDPIILTPQKGLEGLWKKKDLFNI